METKPAILLLIMIFSTSFSSSAVIKNKRKELDTLAEQSHVDTNNAFRSPRSKRQIVAETAGNVEVEPPVAIANQPAKKPSSATIAAIPAPANAISSILAATDQMGQRFKTQLDKLGTEAENLVSSNIDAFTALHNSGVTTKANLHKNLYKLLAGKLRLMLDVIG